MWLRLSQWPVAVVIYLYFALTSSANLQMSVGDKYLHFLGNFLLFLSTWTCWRGHMRWPRIYIALVLFAGIIEGSQYFSEGRAVDPLDMLANIAGLTFALGITLAAHKIFPKTMAALLPQITRSPLGISRPDTKR